MERTTWNVHLGTTTAKLGDSMGTHELEPQVGDLYLSESQGQIHILVAYEFLWLGDFYKYYKFTLKRLDDGALLSHSKPTHEFYWCYKPLSAEVQ